MPDVTPEDVRKGKEEAIKKLANSENLDVSNLSDEEVDNLFGHLSMTEQAKDILECMETLNASETDLVEALRVNMDVKLEEAQEIKDMLFEEMKAEEDQKKLFEKLSK